MSDDSNGNSAAPISGRALGGKARAERLSPERRSEIARLGAAAKLSAHTLKASHGSPDHPLKIGDASIPCYVLPDGTRLLAQRGLQSGIGLSEGGGRSGARRIAELMDSLRQKGVDVRDLVARVNSPIRFVPPHGGNAADGYEAEILPDICAVLIEAGRQGKLGKQRDHLAQRAAMLQHGFATIGIIGLVDEATGYQRDRAKDALSRILEEFIAKELQPYIPTFSADYYFEMFRLRGLSFPKDTSKRPQYFGTLTNDIIFRRLAPGVLEELKKVTPKNHNGKNKAKLFQSLTANKGYPKLREHLGRVIATMENSKNWADFKERLDRKYPRYDLPAQTTFDFGDDDGLGL